MNFTIIIARLNHLSRWQGISRGVDGWPRERMRGEVLHVIMVCRRIGLLTYSHNHAGSLEHRPNRVICI